MSLLPEKFPVPPVMPVEATLVIAVRVSIIPAVPPPAIAAKLHCRQRIYIAQDWQQ